jgi:hypothetical protein
VSAHPKEESDFFYVGGAVAVGALVAVGAMVGGTGVSVGGTSVGGTGVLRRKTNVFVGTIVGMTIIFLVEVGV